MPVQTGQTMGALGVGSFRPAVEIPEGIVVGSRGSPSRGQGRHSGVTFDTHPSVMIRVGVNGAGPQSNWPGNPESQLSPGSQRPRSE